jgi:5-methylcytosine-specific restriction enzyme A
MVSFTAAYDHAGAVDRLARLVAASVADHVDPHHNDSIKFWTGRLQSLCAHCHSSTKAEIECKGYSTAIGPDGLPTDPRHPF